MQNVAQNFVAGIILPTERTIKPGDILGGGNTNRTRAADRTPAPTVAPSLDEEDLSIPNAVLVQETVTNFRSRDMVYRLRATVGVSYDSDLAAAKQALRETADAIGGGAQTTRPAYYSPASAIPRSSSRCPSGLMTRGTRSSHAPTCWRRSGKGSGAPMSA